MTNHSHVKLEYGKHSHRYRRWFLICAICLIGIVILYYWWHNANMSLKVKLLYWQNKCLNYNQPTTKIVINTTSSSEKYTSDQFNRSGSSLAQAKTSTVERPWVQFALAANISNNDVRLGSTLFLHRLTTPNGDERLVHVRVRNPQNITSDFTLAVYVEIVIPATLTTDIVGNAWHTWVRDMNPAPMDGHASTLKIYAGIPDPTDKSRFSCLYEIDGVSGTIDGQLCNDNSVELRVRDGPGFQLDPQPTIGTNERAINRTQR